MHITRIHRLCLLSLLLLGMLCLAACASYEHEPEPEPSPTEPPAEVVLPTDIDPAIRDFLLTPSAAPTPDTIVIGPDGPIITPGGDGSSDVDFQISCRGYSFVDIANYFDEIALRTEYGEDDYRIHKWTSPIFMYVEGSPTAQDRRVIRTIIEKMNSVRGFPGIVETKSESEANVVIHFANNREYDKLTPSNITDKTDGFASCWWTDSVMTRAIIGIRTEISQNERNSVIWEEMVQCTGLQNDSYQYPDSLFYQGYNEVQEPTVLDWLMFEILYHPQMKPGLNREECAIVMLGVLKN